MPNISKAAILVVPVDTRERLQRVRVGQWQPLSDDSDMQCPKDGCQGLGRLAIMQATPMS